MPQASRLNLSQWTELLAKEELPAITSIAVILDRFSNDDVSSIPKLSKAILHDQALSSCLLRVANSSHRSPVHKVTTVSRASIVLGIRAVKNICMTAKILDSMLESRNLLPEVYDRLMTLMANAFFAALLARIMVPEHDENTQEEVYLAAMLYHIGETAFWSTGSEWTEQLINKTHLSVEDFNKEVRNTLGVSFNDMSIGLANTWNLGELLSKALDNPQHRTTEMQIIGLANELTRNIASPPSDKARFDRIISDMAKLMSIDNQHARKRIEQTRKHAIQLLGSYGAKMLENYIKPLPSGADFDSRPSPEAQPQLSQEQRVLLTLQSLTRQARSSHNINQLLAIAVQSTGEIIGFDRSTFWLLNSQRDGVESRISVDASGQQISFHRACQFAEHLNLFSVVAQQNGPLLVNDYKHAKWRNFMTEEMDRLINKGAICLAPVMIGPKILGFVSAQCLEQNGTIPEAQFELFTMIVDHLNLCLSIVSARPQNPAG